MYLPPFTFGGLCLEKQTAGPSEKHATQTKQKEKEKEKEKRNQRNEPPVNN